MVKARISASAIREICRAALSVETGERTLVRYSMRLRTGAFWNFTVESPLNTPRNTLFSFWTNTIPTILLFFRPFFSFQQFQSVTQLDSGFCHVSLDCSLKWGSTNNTTTKRDGITSDIPLEFCSCGSGKLVSYDQICYPRSRKERSCDIKRGIPAFRTLTISESEPLPVPWCETS